MEIEKVKETELKCITCGQVGDLYAIKNLVKDTPIFYICKDGMKELKRDFEEVLKRG